MDQPWVLITLTSILECKVNDAKRLWWLNVLIYSFTYKHA